LEKFGRVSIARNLVECDRVGCCQKLAEISLVDPGQNLAEST